MLFWQQTPICGPAHKETPGKRPRRYVHLHLLPCDGRGDPGIFPAAVCFRKNHLHKHTEWCENGAEQSECQHLCRHLPLPEGDQLQRILKYPVLQQRLYRHAGGNRYRRAGKQAPPLHG